jgi:hypothetical protein
MFNSGVLDVVIGLVFIYLLYSLLATILQEVIASWFSFRPKMLERAIVRMLEDESFARSRFSGIVGLFGKSDSGESRGSMSGEFYNHPLVKFLAERNRGSKPSYIKRETFSKVVIDLLHGEGTKPGEDLRPLIQKALDENRIAGNTPIGEETLRYLRSVWSDAQGDVGRFRESLENWFDETMERATGWYKKHVQFILFFLGLAMAILFNVDTLRIVNKLEKDPNLREQLVRQADAFVKAHPDLDRQILAQEQELETLNAELGHGNLPPAAADSLKQLAADDSLTLARYRQMEAFRDKLLVRADSLVKNDIGKANDLLGLGLKSFDCPRCDWGCFFRSLAGWIITALAISLGAPFWFDMLSKLMKVRNSVRTSSADDKDKQQESQSPQVKRVG